MPSIRFTLSMRSAVALGLTLLSLSAALVGVVIQSHIGMTQASSSLQLPSIDAQKLPETLASDDFSLLQGLPIFARAAPIEPDPAQSEAPIPVTDLKLELKGVFTATNNASAIIQVEKNKSRMFSVGDELTPGVILHMVQTDSVTLNHQGNFEKLSLSGRAGLSSTQSPEQQTTRERMASTFQAPARTTSNRQGFQNSAEAQRAILDAIQSRPNGPGKKKI